MLEIIILAKYFLNKCILNTNIMDPDALNIRISQFNSNTSQASYKKKKKTDAVQLRKSKRADETFKKRNIITDDLKIENLDKSAVFELIKSNNPEETALGLNLFMKITATEASNDYIDICLDYIIQLLLSGEDFIKSQAILVIVSISSSNYSVLASNKIPLLINLIQDSSDFIKEHIFLILGNLALDWEKNANCMFENNLIEISLKILENTQNQKILKKMCWCISCCYQYYLPQQIDTIFSILSFALKENFKSIFPEILLALAKIAKVTTKLFITSGVYIIIIKLLKIDLQSIQKSALRIIGNLFNGDDDDVNALIQRGVCKDLSRALESKNKDVRAIAMWAVSNLCAGRSIEEIITKGIFKQIIDLAITDCTLVQKEAAWALINAASSSDNYILDKMIADGLLSALCYLLSLVEPKIKNVLLKSIFQIL